MPISKQLVVRSTLALLGIGFTALLFVILATMWLGQKAQVHLAEVAAARELRTAATLLRESLLTAETSQRGYVLTGNEIYLAPYDNAKAEGVGQLGRLKSLLSGRSDRRELLDQLSQVVDEKIKEQDTTIALKKARQDGGASEVINSNRGKALMDEANVYLSALALEADDHLSAGVAEQTSNTTWLRWTSFASALVIMGVVAAVVTTLNRYTAEIVAARDEIEKANEALEHRVARRTEELAAARDRAEVLLAEVNHRVANSLALVSSLLRLQARELTEPAAKEALQATNARIQAIAEMHRQLFVTGSVGQVAADTYIEAVLGQLETAMAAAGSSITLKRDLTAITVPTRDAVYLGVVITEWVTNAFKYAYPQGRGEVRVRLEKSAGTYAVTVEDDGIGRAEGEPVKGTGLGTRVVNTIARLLQAEVRYRSRNPGTQAYLSLGRGLDDPAPVVGG